MKNFINNPGREVNIIGEVENIHGECKVCLEYGQRFDLLSVYRQDILY